MIKQTHILQNHNKTDDQTTVTAMIELRDNRFMLEYQISGNLSHYHFPKIIKQQRADKLWLDTSFELFIASANSDEYWEINVSPSTQWNSYYFRSYKEGMRVSNIISTPTIKMHKYHNEYRLSFESIILKENFNQALLINLCVILLDSKGVRHFYSIERREGSPDFHDRAYFTKLKGVSSLLSFMDSLYSS